jgi:hypothetical protein
MTAITAEKKRRKLAASFLPCVIPMLQPQSEGHMTPQGGKGTTPASGIAAFLGRPPMH